ncbi:YraN family protein [Algiphilus sp.]|uniref:YraN family protein n=1 Tax=Algiphilus sp. TaxID=1872431 RepID=UPI003B53014A
MASERARRGVEAEDRALAYLQQQGLRLVARNVRSRGGEIDLVMREGETLVFVEVRFRQRRDHGGALASIDARKQQRMLHAARVWLSRHPEDAMRGLRFDVVAFEADEGAQWLRNVLDVTAP